LVGYGLIDTWLAGLAPFGGVLLLSGVAAAMAAAGVQILLVHERTRGVALVAIGAIVAVWAVAFGAQQLQWGTAQPTRSVALVQGNVEQITKWLPENRLPILQRYEALTEPHWGADLIIWPESAITLYASQAAPWLERWDVRGKHEGSSLLLGLPDMSYAGTGGNREPNQEAVFYNSAVVVGAGQGRYIKRRLVPFGEYVPFASVLRGLIEFFDLPMSDAGVGPPHQVLPQVGWGAVGIAICYEIAYSELVRTSAAASSVIVTISNDAWFGTSIGPHQHLQIARMRALENARFVLRATNNGLTAVIDPRGQVTASLPQFEQGVLEASWQPMLGLTPFTRLGYWPAVGLAWLWLMLCVVHNFRRR
jgi:apolipoprotein N-acyltransferase